MVSMADMEMFDIMSEEVPTCGGIYTPYHTMLLKPNLDLTIRYQSLTHWYLNNSILLNFILDTQGWGVSPRGAGYLFGSDVVQQVSR